MEHLEGLELGFFFEQFTPDATLKMEGMDFAAVKAAFVEKFAILEAP